MLANDKQLIKSFLAGDERAFEQLLKIYLKPIYNFLYQLTKDKAQAEDLTQVTFIKVWQNFRRFDQKKKFKTWLFAIAKNTAYDYFKKKKSLPFSDFIGEDGDNKLENIAEENILPDELLMKTDLAEELDAKLQKIPAGYRAILLMRYQDDFSLAEIAEILGKPYNTVKAYHKRALLRLKKAFLEH